MFTIIPRELLPHNLVKDLNLWVQSSHAPVLAPLLWMHQIHQVIR